jgi:3-oxoacyl-[acyl-carrier protein] reductase
MDLKLRDKNVFVSGSSRGIGSAIASAFLAEGANVVTNSRREVSEGRRHIVADVLRPDGIPKIKEELEKTFNGQLDVLVCNVGSGSSVPPGTETSEDWKRSFDTNFFSTTNVVEGLRSMLRPGGSILCISSICGLEQFGAPLTYSSSKAALNAYVVGLSKVLGKSQIRVNAIAPGNILFDGSVWDRKLKENETAVRQMLERDVALKRLGTPTEVANVALFISSEHASFIPGTILVSDGGKIRSW